MRALIGVVFVLGLLVSAGAQAAAPVKATVYKDPLCGCCHEYVAYLRENGFEVAAVDTGEMEAVKRHHGVPPMLSACHTTLVGGYVVEGHVSAAVISRLLAERPSIKGVALPGMPAGSPGMAGPKSGPLVIFELSEESPKVFAVE